MSEIRVRRRPSDGLAAVATDNPLPVSIESINYSPALAGVPVYADYIWRLAAQGKIFIATDGLQTDVVTGQTSFANTTPTFLLDVPSGTTAIPLFVNLAQAGTVAGGAINVLVEMDNIGRYSTGGTSEKVLSISTLDRLANRCPLYTGATALAGYGTMLKHIFQVPQDVAPAISEGYDWHQIEWTPPVPLFLAGPAALLIYTYAATTGPSWLWNIGWAEIPTNSL